MTKREAPATEATALEALLRGDGILDKRNNNSKEEETLLEIQVTHPAPVDLEVHDNALRLTEWFSIAGSQTKNRL